MELNVKHIAPFIFTAILIVSGGYLNAQIQLRHLPGMNNSGYIPQRSCFEIVNMGPAIQSTITIKIKNIAADSVVLELESPTIDIPTGNMQVLPALLEQFKTLYIDSKNFTSPFNLVKGNYVADVVLKQKTEGVEIAYLSIPINVTVENKNVIKSNKAFSTYGTAQVTGVLSTRQQSFSGMPQNYVQSTIDPNVVMFGLPVSAHITLSSLNQSGQAQNLNTFSINYNANALKALLKNKLDEAIKKNENFENLSKLKSAADINQYTNFKKVLENPAVKNELLELANLDTLVNWKDSINNYKNAYQQFIPADTAGQLYKKYQEALVKYQDSTKAITEAYKFFPVDTSKAGRYRDSIAKIIIKVEKLEEHYNTLKAKKEGYDKLIKNKDELEQKLQSIGLVDSLGNTIGNAKSKIKDVKETAAGLKDNYNNPEYLQQKLKDNHLLRGVDKVMMIVNKVNIGTSYPVISPLTLNGVRVNGVNIELTPKNTFIAVTYGTILNPVQSFNLSTASYKRKIWSTTFGYGNIDRSHLYFTIQSSADDSSSITPRDSIFKTVKLPQSNYIISSHFKFQLFKENLSIYGEVAGSQTTRDLKLNNPDSSTYTTTYGNGNPRQWVRNIFTQKPINTNTVTDHAYTGGVELTLFKGRSRFTIAYKHIGSNFQTFGVPFLINDMQTMEGKLTQKIWKGRIQLGATVKHNTDNLNGAKLITTKNYQFGGDIRIAIPKWPTFRASYVPVMLQNDSTKVLINILNVNANYQYKIGRVKNVITAAYVQQHLASTDSSLNYSSTNAMVSHTTFLSKNISVNVSANYIRFNSPSLPSINTINISASTSFGLFKQRLSNTIGATLIKNENEIRYGFFYYGGYTISKYVSTSIRLENNQYNSYVVNPALSIPYFSEFICQLSLALKW